MAKTKTKRTMQNTVPWPALESVFAELADAIDRKKFTKARRLAAQVEHNVIMSGFRHELSQVELNTYHARLKPLWASIPPKPWCPATKRERQTALKQSMMTASKSDFWPAS